MKTWVVLSLSSGTYSHLGNTVNKSISGSGSSYSKQTFVDHGAAEGVLQKVLFGTCSEEFLPLRGCCASEWKTMRTPTNAFMILLLNLKQMCWWRWKCNLEIKWTRKLREQIRDTGGGGGEGALRPKDTWQSCSQVLSGQVKENPNKIAWVLTLTM